MTKTFFGFFVLSLGVLSGVFAMMIGGLALFAYIIENLSNSAVLSVTVLLVLIVSSAVLAFSITLMDY